MPKIPSNHHSEESGSIVTGPTHQLDIIDLDTAVQHLFINGLAPSTVKNYQLGNKRFITFCNSYHVSSPVPVNEH